MFLFLVGSSRPLFSCCLVVCLFCFVGFSHSIPSAVCHFSDGARCVSLSFPTSSGPCRGGHSLEVFGGGFPRCISCCLCVSECPSSCITICASCRIYRYIVALSQNEWEVSYNRCIFCGLCDSCCPVGSIVMDSS
jgi:ferredoxin